MEHNGHLYDTNVLMRNIEHLDTVERPFIPLVVVEELDKLKLSDGTDRAWRARIAIRKLEQLGDKIIYVENLREDDVVSTLNIQKNDNMIVELAKFHGCVLVTADLNMRLKARARNVPFIKVDDGDEILKYKGITELLVDFSLEDQQMLAELYENPDANILGLLVNGYLAVKDKDKPIFDDTTGELIDYESIDNFRWNGERLVKLALPPQKTVKGKNAHQMCALDLLFNRDIPIKIIAGTYGSGKTYLSIRTGQYLVSEKGKYDHLLIVRNPVGSGEEIGFLPGNKEEKIMDFFKPIEHNIDGGADKIEWMLKQAEIGFEIPFYMKGMSIKGTFIHVEEAEDLDIKTIKLIGTRLAEGSCVAFTGDYKQAEGKFIHDNGLLHLIDKLKGHPLVGICVLKEDVRSEASKVFADL